MKLNFDFCVNFTRRFSKTAAKFSQLIVLQPLREAPHQHNHIWRATRWCNLFGAAPTCTEFDLSQERAFRVPKRSQKTFFATSRKPLIEITRGLLRLERYRL